MFQEAAGQFSDSTKVEWLKLGFYTPFYSNEISATKAEQLFEIAASEAIETLSGIRGSIKSSAQAMLVFDSLLDDYVENKCSLSAVKWRQNCFLHRVPESAGFTKVSEQFNQFLTSI